MTLHEETDLHWAKASDEPDGSWHLIARTFISRASFYFMETRCGLERPWDQTFVDRLPGGDEKSCENCLLLLAGDVDTDSDPAPKKKSAKAK